MLDLLEGLIILIVILIIINIMINNKMLLIYNDINNGSPK